MLYEHPSEYPQPLNQRQLMAGVEFGYDVIEIESPFTLEVGQRPSSGHDQVQQRMTIILAAVVFLTVLFALFRLNATVGTVETSVTTVEQAEASTADVAPAPVTVSGNGQIAPIFAPSVQYWADEIVAWSEAAGVDPNMAATVMQIESCGDPLAISSAGAQGLFQVMPFHFQPGEDSLDPDTNAMRGLNYLAERLVQTSGDVGRAFAGYNGGHVAAAGSWNTWVHETQRYFVWSTGIYEEARQGLSESPTLARWMSAGGASLCQQAAQRLGIQAGS